MIWIININSNLCRIYHYQKKPMQLTLMKEIQHPELRMKEEAMLTSDRPGHFHSSTTARGAFEPRTDPKEAEIDHFMRDVSKELTEGRVKNLYDHIIIIAPPHVMGLLTQHLDKHVKELVTNQIQKDLIYLKEHELLEFIKTHAQYPDQ